MEKIIQTEKMQIKEMIKTKMIIVMGILLIVNMFITYFQNDYHQKQIKLLQITNDIVYDTSQLKIIDLEQKMQKLQLKYTFSKK